MHFRLRVLKEWELYGDAGSCEVLPLNLLLWSAENRNKTETNKGNIENSVKLGVVSLTNPDLTASCKYYTGSPLKRTVARSLRA